MEKLYFYKTPVTYGMIDLDEPGVNVAKVVAVLVLLTVVVCSLAGLLGFVAGI